MRNFLLAVLALLAFAGGAQAQYDRGTPVSPRGGTLRLPSSTGAFGVQVGACPSGYVVSHSATAVFDVYRGPGLTTTGATQVGSVSASNGGIVSWVRGAGAWLVLDVTTTDANAQVTWFCGDSALGGDPDRINCQNEPPGTQCSTNALAYTSYLGTRVPTPEGDVGDLRHSKGWGDTGQQLAATSVLGFANQWSMGGWWMMGDQLAAAETRGIVQLVTGGTNNSRVYITFEGYNAGSGAVVRTGVRAQLYNNAPVLFKDFRYRTDMIAGQWACLVFTFDGEAAGDPFELHKDGRLFNRKALYTAAATDNAGTMENPARQITLGANGGGVNDDLNIHSFGIWDYALTPREIADFCNSSWGRDPGDFGAVHAWRFCQNGDIATSDVSDIGTTGGVPFPNSGASGTQTCNSDQFIDYPATYPRYWDSTLGATKPRVDPPVSGRSCLFSFGDSQAGEHCPYDVCLPDANYQADTDSIGGRVAGGWVYDNQGDGGTFCDIGTEDATWTDESVHERVTAWIAAGGPTQDARLDCTWDNTWVTLTCGANDVRAIGPPPTATTPVAAADTWTAKKAIVDELHAAGIPEGQVIITSTWPFLHQTSGCNHQVGGTTCDATTDAEALRAYDGMQYESQKAAEEGYAYCNLWDELWSMTTQSFDSYPVADDTNVGAYMDDYIHPAWREGWDLASWILQTKCLPPPRPFVP